MKKVNQSIESICEKEKERDSMLLNNSMSLRKHILWGLSLFFFFFFFLVGYVEERPW